MLVRSLTKKKLTTNKLKSFLSLIVNKCLFRVCLFCTLVIWSVVHTLEIKGYVVLDQSGLIPFRSYAAYWFFKQIKEKKRRRKINMSNYLINLNICSPKFDVH